MNWHVRGTVTLAVNFGLNLEVESASLINDGLIREGLMLLLEQFPVQLSGDHLVNLHEVIIHDVDYDVEESY